MPVYFGNFSFRRKEEVSEPSKEKHIGKHFCPAYKAAQKCFPNKSFLGRGPEKQFFAKKWFSRKTTLMMEKNLVGDVFGGAVLDNFCFDFMPKAGALFAVVFFGVGILPKLLIDLVQYGLEFLLNCGIEI
jgi:hypothetical protein